MVHDVAVTQDCQRMLVVGTLTASQDGLHPSKSRAEKQIIGKSLFILYKIDITEAQYSLQFGQKRNRKVSSLGCVRQALMLN